MGDMDDELKKTRRLWKQGPDLTKELGLSNSIAAAMAESSRLTQDLGLTHSLAKMFTDQEAIARQYALNPAFKDMLSWRESSALSSVLETLRGHDFLHRAVIGPLADMKRLGLLSASVDIETAMDLA